ncbi:protein of unknown function [Clostridium beijerinckii]|nr:protein of unknown function [Clostridium beijerinckii]
MIFYISIRYWDKYIEIFIVNKFIIPGIGDDTYDKNLFI